MEGYDKECECGLLAMLMNAESLSVKKARIYSRLLTDTALAEDMEALAVRHEQREKALKKLSGGDVE